MAEETRPRKPRAFKIALLIALGLFVLLAAGVYLLPHFLPVETIREMAKKQAMEAAGLDVDFTGLGLSWSGGAIVEGVTLATPAPDGARILAIERVNVNVAWLPLLSGRVVVDSVVVDGLSASLTRRPDGSWNIPEIPGKPAAAAETAAARPAGPANMLSAAAAAEPPAASDIQVNQVRFRNMHVAVSDPAAGMDLGIRLDELQVDGGDINGPLNFRGNVRLDRSERGSVEFSGTAGLVRNNAFDPEGSASAEARIDAFSLRDLAAQLGMGGMISGGEAAGTVKAAYRAGKAALDISGLRLADVAADIGGGSPLEVPPATVSLSASFDPAEEKALIETLSIAGDFETVAVNGWVGGFSGMEANGLPLAEIDFSGDMDFGKALAFAAKQGLLALPATIGGRGAFSGQAAIRAVPGQSAPVLVNASFSDGAVEMAGFEGVSGSVNLANMSFQATLGQGGPDAVTASAEFKSVPVSVTLPDMDGPAAVTLNGAAAFVSGGGRPAAAELRLMDASAAIPGTPYSLPVEIAKMEVQATVDLDADTLDLAKATFQTGGDSQISLHSGQFRGVLAGTPSGRVDADFSSRIDEAANIVSPLLAGLPLSASGLAKGGIRIVLDQESLEVFPTVTLDAVAAELKDGAGSVAAELERAVVNASVRADTRNLSGVEIPSLVVENGGVSLKASSGPEESYEAKLMPGKLEASGTMRFADLALELSRAAFSLSGASVVHNAGAVRAAEFSTGTVAFAAAPANGEPMLVPVSGAGPVNLPGLTLSADNAAFRREGDSEAANLGTIQVAASVGGILGVPAGGGASVLEIRKLDLGANPVRLAARASLDNASGAVALSYGARVAPDRARSVLGYLGIPLSLSFGEAVFTGELSWNGSALAAKGSSNGSIGFGSGEADAFRIEHDLTCGVFPDGSVDVDMRRLDAMIQKSPQEAIVTLRAQKSRLRIAQDKADGFLDIRLEGVAPQTRMLFLGLCGALPQLREYLPILEGAAVGGAYEAYVQIQGRDAQALLNMGGRWKGASVRAGNTDVLSEPRALELGINGVYDFASRTADLKKAYFNAESTGVQAVAAATVSLAADGAGTAAGIGNIQSSFRAVVPDLARARFSFPGIIPEELALAGSLDATMTASGTPDALTIGNGRAAFSNFRVRPGGMNLVIPQGAAEYGAVVGLVEPPARSGPPGPYDALLGLSVRDGRFSLTGAQFENSDIQTMAAAFRLEDGVFGLDSFQLSIGRAPDNGQASVRGTLDFKPPEPAADFAFAIESLPISEATKTLGDFFTATSGVINLPASAGTEARAVFSGFSTEGILGTLRLDNFNFATGPVALTTGPRINEELDKAAAIIKMETGKTRNVTLKSVTGTALADGRGIVLIPKEQPIAVTGDNTADLAITGGVFADNTINLDILVTGQIENLVYLPRLVPNLSGREDQTRFMQKINQNAARGHYTVKVSGPMDNPAISGIPELAGRFITDMMAAAPGAFIGGAIDMGKNAQSAVRNVGRLLGGAAGQAGQGGAAPQEGQPQQLEQQAQSLLQLFQPQQQQTPQQQAAPQQQQTGQQVQSLLHLFQPQQQQQTPQQQAQQEQPPLFPFLQQQQPAQQQVAPQQQAQQEQPPLFPFLQQQTPQQQQPAPQQQQAPSSFEDFLRGQLQAR